MTRPAQCARCKSAIDSLARFWTLCTEEQRIVWPPSEGVEHPAIDLDVSNVVGEYCSDDCAQAALNEYLALLSARATWADVRPIEECSSCGGDIDTSTRHLTIALEELSGTYEEQESHGIEYPARFCANCNPANVRGK